MRGYERELRGFEREIIHLHIYHPSSHSLYLSLLRFLMVIIMVEVIFIELVFALGFQKYIILGVLCEK